MKSETMLRLIVLLVMGATFLISGLYRSRIRQEAGPAGGSEEGRTFQVLRMIFAVPLFLILLLEIFLPAWTLWARIALPYWLRLVGAVFALLSLVWLWWVFRSLSANFTGAIPAPEPQDLVTSGPYQLVRHPLYAGSLLMLLGFGLVFENWLILALTLAGILAFRLLVIPEEEKQLLEAFGEDYECYQSRTGALLPWIR